MNLGMFKIPTLFFIIFSISYIDVGAQTVTPEQIIQSSFSDEKVMRDAQMETFIQGLDYHLPMVKKLEARVGFNGNNTKDSLDGNLRNEDYYSISLTTNKWREMKLQKAIKPAQYQVYSKEKEMLLMQALQDRYLVLINLYYSQESLTKRKELQTLLNTKNQLLQQMLNDGINIKISDALDVEKDLIQLYGLLQEDESSVVTYTARIGQFMNYALPVNVNFMNLIGLKKVIINSVNLKQDSSKTHPNLEYKEAQYRFAKADYQLEKVQNTNIINSFQIGYNKPAYSPEILKKFNPDNTLTFRVGIALPLPANNSYGRNSANIQQYNALLNWQSAQALQVKSTSIQYSRLENSIRQYNTLLDIYEKGIVSKLLKNEQVMAQSTALEIIDLKIAQKKLEINLINSAGNLMQSYVSLLESKGLLKYDLRNIYLLEN